MRIGFDELEKFKRFVENCHRWIIQVPREKAERARLKAEAEANQK